MVRARYWQRSARYPGETGGAGRNHLDEGVHHGARALRRGRHCAFALQLRGETRLAAPCPAFRRTMACAAEPSCSLRIHLPGAEAADSGIDRERIAAMD